MNYSRRKLAQAYVELMDQHSASDLAKGLATLFMKQRRAVDAELLGEEIAYAIAKKQHTAVATVTSARKLSKAVKDRIASYVRHTENMKYAQLSYVIDETLLGGASIQTATHTYTFSVTGKVRSIL